MTSHNNRHSNPEKNRRSFGPSDGTWWQRNMLAIPIFVGLVVVLGGLNWHLGPLSFAVLVAGVAYVSVKLVLSSGYRPACFDGTYTGTVAVIVPVYNEDPALLKQCLLSVLRQTHPADEIYVVDDGSSSDACMHVAASLFGTHAGAVVHQLERNMGKRHAQAWALRRTSADVIVTIDSDTVLEPNAIEEGLKPFADEHVQAVTGYVRALNHRTNLLTKLIALRYANVFLYERTAYSMLGSVVCCCGSLSLVRAPVILDNLDDYVNQTFLGRNVMYGDDRRLTNYALTRGKVAIQTSAVASTMVPERLNHFARQQIRWTKSFFRETLWALTHFRRNRWIWWLSLAELTTWVFTSIVLALLVVSSAISTNGAFAWRFAAGLTLMAYARSVRYPRSEPESGWYQLAVFLLAPLYALLHFVMLVPLRYYSLATLRDGGWGTRAEIEVSLEGSRKE
jgi:hyaluronan synthase